MKMLIKKKKRSGQKYFSTGQTILKRVGNTAIADQGQNKLSELLFKTATL